MFGVDSQVDLGGVEHAWDFEQQTQPLAKIPLTRHGWYENLVLLHLPASPNPHTEIPASHGIVCMCWQGTPELCALRLAENSKSDMTSGA